VQAAQKNRDYWIRHQEPGHYRRKWSSAVRMNSVLSKLRLKSLSLSAATGMKVLAAAAAEAAGGGYDTGSEQGDERGSLTSPDMDESVTTQPLPPPEKRRARLSAPFLHSRAVHGATAALQ
jgi:hypothetical protein